MSDAATLKRAMNEIERRGWVHGAWFLSGGVCTETALLLACGRSELSIMSEPCTHSKKEAALFSRFIVSLNEVDPHPTDGMEWNSPRHWNDCRRGLNKQRVLKMLRIIADQWEAQDAPAPRPKRNVRIEKQTKKVLPTPVPDTVPESWVKKFGKVLSKV